jgi:dipeptidyl aminopeptidase/acylaminoacyl peptidase
MFNVLQARKVPSKLVTFPDENHVSTKTQILDHFKTAC